MRTSGLAVLRLLLLGVVGLLWIAKCAGQAPSGQYVYDILPGTGPRLWDLSGYYTAEPLWLTLDHQDARGRLWFGEKALGMVSGNGKVARFRLCVRDSWWEVPQFPVGGIALQRTRIWTLNVDTNSVSMSGIKRTVERRIEMLLWQRKDKGTKTYQEFVTVPLAEGNDGHWQLALNLIPNGNRLTGTAILTFATGATLQFRLLGSYFPKTGDCKLVLTGDGADRGASLRVTLGGAEMEIKSMRGTVAGQVVRFEILGTQEPGWISTGLRFGLAPNALLIPSRQGLVILRLLDLLPNHPQRLFQELGGLFAIRSFEPDCINLDFS